VGDEALTELTTTLRRAFTVALGPDLAADALGEALAYYAENGERVRSLENPTGYLFTVGRRRAERFTRTRRSSRTFPPPASVGMPDVEPRLVDAIARLSERQRVCVVLVHGFGYRNREVGELLDISAESVQTHCRRALTTLRDELGEVS
jgi:DNA-directed RNA polymerase specialized sigma24 family protein